MSLRAQPWWAQVLGVYVLARVVSALVLVAVAQEQVANLWTPQAPSYLQFTGLMWDASWYREIAEQGYPQTLPVGDDGTVAQNAWAFYPLFPLLARLVMSVTGAPWQSVGPLLAVVLGAAAMLVIYRAIEAGAPRAVAARPGLPLATVALVATFPTAVVLQIAYTESLALLLVAAVLLALIRRRYVPAAALVLALGFTRAVALPMAVVVAVHVVARWRAARRGEDAVPRRDVGGMGLLLAAAVVAGFAWPAVCAAVTGRPDAYLETQAAWRARPGVVPVLPWLDVARWLAGQWGPFLLGAVLLAVAVLVTSPPARRAGAELFAWPIAYLAYLVGVIEPGTSLARFLLLAFPLGAVTAGMVRGSGRRPRLWLAALVVAGTLLQVGWVWMLWRLTPPSGWPP
ncbi:hypothetical protein [Pengzhenrongella sicca]|uniref:Glycosyltransferase RgtA/B/C/D-like domain-containing protein n=1 Tax=Pengzhenrongella sicca TaxID=2819238 RepID=A0A8A4ZBL5_9MICO|nr:hypothetical protein [Pengzhenrongella sicca]QTE28811.1 hypothetical protein J4E96_15965 [Pengzhenrongella sicca]